MTTADYLKEAPGGTTPSQMQKIIERCNGERAKINSAIKVLWAKHSEDSSWVAVSKKTKKKSEKTFGNNKGKKPHPNQKQKSSQRPSKGKYRPSNIPQITKNEEDNSPPANSWASTLFSTKQEPEPKQTIVVNQVVTKPEIESVPKNVKDVEAELFKESKKLEEAKLEEVKKPEPIVKPGVSFPLALKRPDSKNISFGTSKTIKIDIFSLAEKEGVEIHPKGTQLKVKSLENDLSRAEEKYKRLEERQEKIEGKLSEALEKNRKYSDRVQELETSAKEKDNLTDQVTQLRKQLEENQIHTRQLYDRMKDEPKKDDEKVKQSNQPAVTTAPQQGYNLPQHQQHMYPTGMQYFPQYYSQFPYHQNHGPPQSRYNYENHNSHPPPSHPPGPGSPSPPPEHHGHFPPGHGHEGFRGMRRAMAQPPSRDIGMEKNAQHAPPGYGNTQHQPYGYPPNIMYQQQQQQFPPGEGQKWSGGR